uniref:Uncharacterized protein n=1 Tax=Strongyloides venezuelensis TaxID=75913 RepID=A0A0K0EU05_STRVS
MFPITTNILPTNCYVNYCKNSFLFNIRVYFSCI